MEGRKSALVTGSGMGIGRGIALTLAQAGYDVAIHYNNSKETALSACAQIETLGVRAAAIQADISTQDGIKSLFRQYRERFEMLDVYVNNSGISLDGRFLEMTEETFDTICSVNWKGAYFCIQQAAKIMVEKKTAGSIVIVSSNQQELEYPGCSAYGAMKAALNRLCRYAALELAEHGIRVNVIAPGYTDTGSPRMGEKESTYCEIPLRRWCTPEEIGHAVLFFSSPYALSITGASLMIDGGAVLKR